MNRLEFANFTLIPVRHFYKELIPALSYLFLLLTSLEEYLFEVWSFITSHYLNILMICLIYTITNYVFYKKYFSDKEFDENILNHRRISGCERVLFVIAHPDDECMFFGPTILSLVKSKAQVYLVCLSVGDKYGRGKERKEELWSACETLGINSSFIWLYKHDKLKDDPKVEWRTGLVASLILRTIETLDIDTVITFDKYGVSGHKNHISIYKAMTLLRNRNSLPPNCRVYLLDSVCLIRKYTFYIDVMFTWIFSKSYIHVTNMNEHNLIVSAMAKYVSQYVWYRKLFMKFSRYSYVNSLSTFIG